MHCAQKMTHNIYWIGSNDWTTERFENLFPIPNGVSYNSYFIDDEKTCVVDSVDAEIREEYFDNLTHLLNGRDLDYIIVNHMGTRSFAKHCWTHWNAIQTVKWLVTLQHSACLNNSTILQNLTNITQLKRAMKFA